MPMALLHGTLLQKTETGRVYFYHLPIIHEDLIIYTFYSNVLTISAFVVAGLPQTSPDKSTLLLYKDNRRHEIRFGL